MEPIVCGVVSRLDKPVSGVVILERKVCCIDFSRTVSPQNCQKEYLAIVEKRFPSVLGEWVTWRDRIYWDDVLRRAVIEGVKRQNGTQARSQKAGGNSNSAETSVRVIKRAGEVSLVELQPKTGRRHQLRAQLAFRGCPIVGDRMYGSRLPLSFQADLVVALHAQKLTFEHPKTGESMTVEAKIPRLWKSRYAVLF